jgi:streptogramin lyase
MQRVWGLCLIVALASPVSARAAGIAPGDLLMTCPYWGITRIDPATGEQRPLGVGVSGQVSPVVVDDAGLVWVVDNRWVVSIDRATGDHRLALQLPQDFDDFNDGELLPEPGGTLLWAGDGAVSRIDPEAGTLTPVVSGPPLETPIGLAWAPNGDLLIGDNGAGAIFRWNEIDGVSTVTSGNLLTAPTKVRVLADGDLIVLRASSPVRVDPVSGAQSIYSASIPQAISVEVAVNGDLIFSNNAGTSGLVRRSTAPTAIPVTLLDVRDTPQILNARNLALTADGRAIIAGNVQEITDGAVTDSQQGFFEFDLATSQLRVLSAHPHPGGLVSTPTGRLFVAGVGGGESVREVNPRTGEMRLVVHQDPLVNEPVDAVLEPGGTLAVLNGIPNGDPSITRVDPDTGATSLITGGSLFVDPEKLAVDAAGTLYVGDMVTDPVVAVDPVTGAESVVPGTENFEFVSDLAVEASGDLLVVQHAANRIVRVDPVLGNPVEVAPPIGPFPPRAFNAGSAFALGLDGTPWVSLTPNNGSLQQLYRAPFGAGEVELVSTLPLCSGNEMEVVRAVPEPGAPLAGAAVLAALALCVRWAEAFPSRRSSV